jgi:hypothetical protein
MYYYVPHQETYETLTNMNVSKDDIFKELSITFDYALPQDWLDMLANLPGAPSYDAILSTTVWGYPPGNIMGIPITACIEVQAAINKLYN